MSLRTRIALLAGVIVLIASTIGGIGVALSSRNVGRDRLDEELRQDASRFDASEPGLGAQLQFVMELRRSTCEDETTESTTQSAQSDSATSQAQGGASGPRQRGERLAQFVPEFAANMQVVRATGVVVSSCGVLPFDAQDQAIAAQGYGSNYRTASVDGERVRILTVGYGDLGAVQFARDLDLTEDTLRGLFLRIAGFGLIGAALAAGLGWLLARRATAPVQDLSETVARVAATRDLGERISIDRNDEIGALASTVNTMLESLDTSREQQQRLVQDASHELRTPLTSMRTNVELLQRHQHIDAELRGQVLADIEVELAELTELTAELVESATEVPTDLQRATPIELGELVEECIGRARRRHRREIDLEAHRTPSPDGVGPGDAVVHGDPALLARAITNLVNNAVKFSGPDSPITVVHDAESVRVLDRGPGVDEADLPHVFDRFYRATAARSAPGSGLGLSIVKQIVEGHGGSLFATNRVGGGFEVGFRLPPARSSASGGPDIGV